MLTKIYVTLFVRITSLLRYGLRIQLFGLCIGLIVSIAATSVYAAIDDKEIPILYPSPEFQKQAGEGTTTIPHQGTTTIPQSRSGLTVNLESRQEALAFYNAVYLPSNNIPLNWDGDTESCQSGTTSPIFRQAMERRINYFRAMAGVPADIKLLDEYNQKAQQAALMMSANQQLDHTPPSSWRCHTSDGVTAAGSSNLFLGISGAGAIDGYIRDPGAGNAPVGHRTWILYPQTQAMGTGDVPDNNDYRAANALWVFDNTWDQRPPTRETFVSWPPPGYVPHTLVYPRWSFSYPEADFKNATATVTENGVAVPLTIEAAENDDQRSVLVWRMKELGDYVDWLTPTIESSYEVTVSGVKIDNEERSFSYTVTPFDPGAVVDGTASSVALNYAVGAPGSYFTIVGRDFAPQALLDVGIRGNAGTSTTINADAEGRFAVILDSTGVDNGTLTVSITPRATIQRAALTTADLITIDLSTTTPSTATYLTIDPAAPKRAKEEPTDGPVAVLVELNQNQNTNQNMLYLPLTQH